MKLLNFMLLSLTTVLILSSQAMALATVKECGHKNTSDESIKDCFSKLGREKTIQCFTFGDKGESQYFPCDSWEEKKKEGINLYLQKLEDYKENSEQIWNIVSYYVPDDNADPDAPGPVAEKSCGLSGSDEEKIEDCKNKLGVAKTIQCFAEPFPFVRKTIKCEDWKALAKSNISLGKQVLVTLKNWGDEKKPEMDWKSTDRFSAPAQDDMAIDNFNKPKFPNATCGSHGAVSDRIADCEQIVAAAGSAYAARICYLGRNNSVDNLRKVPCTEGEQLGGNGILFQSWRLISMDNGENKVWLDENTKKVWSSLLPKTSSVFSAIKTCHKGKSTIISGIAHEVAFSIPTCGEITSSMQRGLKKLIPLEQASGHDAWCSVDSGVLLKWNTMNNSVQQSQNPFENNSLICAGNSK